MSQHTYDGCGMCRYCGAGNYEVARGRKPPECPRSPPQDKADAANMYGHGLEQGYRDAIEKGQAEIDELKAVLSNKATSRCDGGATCPGATCASAHTPAAAKLLHRIVDEMARAKEAEAKLAIAIAALQQLSCSENIFDKRFKYATKALAQIESAGRDGDR